MALRYNGTTIGKVRIAQEREDGRHIYTLQIRQGNCLAVLIHVRKATEEDNRRYGGKGGYIHDLWTFYADEQHMKNILKNEGDLFFGEEVTSISLNLFYKECRTLLKYFTWSGHKVNCYYKEEKEK